MSTDIIIQVRQPPEIPGYNDTLLVVLDNHFVFACPCSAGPNHRQTRRKGGGDWQRSYGQAAPGNYPLEIVNHYKYGMCILINGARDVPSRVPNPRQKMQPILTELFVHRGSSKRWRGSAGCPVVHPLFWKCFQHFLTERAVGQITILDVPTSP